MILDQISKSKHRSKTSATKRWNWSTLADGKFRLNAGSAHHRRKWTWADWVRLARNALRLFVNTTSVTLQANNVSNIQENSCYTRFTIVRVAKAICHPSITHILKLQTHSTPKALSILLERLQRDMTPLRKNMVRSNYNSDSHRIFPKRFYNICSFGAQLYFRICIARTKETLVNRTVEAIWKSGRKMELNGTKVPRMKTKTEWICKH